MVGDYHGMGRFDGEAILGAILGYPSWYFLPSSITVCYKKGKLSIVHAITTEKKLIFLM